MQYSWRCVNSCPAEVADLCQHQHWGRVTSWWDNMALWKSHHRQTGFWGRRLTRHLLEHWWFSCHPALPFQSISHVFTMQDGTRTAHLERPWEHTGKTAFAGLPHFCSWLTDIHYWLRIFPESSVWAQDDKISNTFLFFPCHGLQLLQGHISFRTHMLQATFSLGLKSTTAVKFSTDCLQLFVKDLGHITVWSEFEHCHSISIDG